MIHEYAVDPAIVDSWERLQRLMSQFGFHNARLIGRVPGNWRKAVLESLPESCGETDRSRIVQRLRDFNEAAFISRQHQWVPGASWLRNATAADADQQFRLILSADSSSPENRTIKYDDLDEGCPPPGWDPDDGDVERTPAEMANRLRLVLQTAKRLIVFVDPNFHPATPRFRDVFVEYCRCIQQSNYLRPTTRLELHVSDRFERSNYQRELNTHLSAAIPQGPVLNVVRWPNHLLHNRYVLTEKAGVSMGIGLDRNHKGTQGISKDTFSLIGRQAWRDQLARYTADNSSFGVSPDVITVECRKH